MNSKWFGIVFVVLAIGLFGFGAVFAQETTTNPLQQGQQGRGPRGGHHLDVIAATLGLEADALRTQLEAGQTVAQIAEAQGVELSVVVDALVAEHQEKLTQAVAEGRLTQEEADARLAQLTEDLPTRLSEPFEARGPMGEGRGGRGGQGRGPRNGQNAPLAPEATPDASADV